MFTYGRLFASENCLTRKEVGEGRLHTVVVESFERNSRELTITHTRVEYSTLTSATGSVTPPPPARQLVLLLSLTSASGQSSTPQAGITTLATPGDVPESNVSLAFVRFFGLRLHQGREWQYGW